MLINQMNMAKKGKRELEAELNNALGRVSNLES
jgi:hypothetical protein